MEPRKEWRAMMWLKACPKCGGDLYPELDLDSPGTHLACLQCGRSLSSAEEGAVKLRIARRAQRAVAERQHELVAQTRLMPAESVMASHLDG